MPPPTTASPMTLKRIHREIADLKKEDMGAMTLSPSDDNLFLWKGQIPGPEGSVYEGGLFNLDVTLAQDYPFSAPRVIFKTRIYHMNISDRGDICIDLLKNNWSPALSLFKVLLSLSSLLTDPNPRDPLVGAIANQYTTNRTLHDSTAKQWTDLYARPPPALSKIDAPSAKARGKAKATNTGYNTRSETASVPSSSSQTRSAPVMIQDPITIEDSEEEAEKKRIKSRSSKRGSAGSNRVSSGIKRKRRQGSGSGNVETLDESEDDGDVVDVDNDEGEIVFTEGSTVKGRSRKAQKTSRMGVKSSNRAVEASDSDVIVIDDD